MNTAEKLIKLRKEKGFTQSELARELGIALASIKHYENLVNPRIPEAKILYKISKYFNVSLEYLIDDNITAYSKNNIEISKELGFSDETIRNIKDINDHYKNMLNRFLKHPATYNFLVDFFSMNELNIIKESINSCYIKIKYDNSKKTFFTLNVPLPKYININNGKLKINNLDEVTLAFDGIKYKEVDISYIFQLLDDNKKIMQMIKNYFYVTNKSTWVISRPSIYLLFDKLNMLEDIDFYFFNLDNIKHFYSNIKLDEIEIIDGKSIAHSELLINNINVLNNILDSFLEKINILINVTKSTVDEEFDIVKYCFIDSEIKKEFIKDYAKADDNLKDELGEVINGDKGTGKGKKV